MKREGVKIEKWFFGSSFAMLGSSISHTQADIHTQTSSITSQFHWWAITIQQQSSFVIVALNEVGNCHLGLTHDRPTLFNLQLWFLCLHGPKGLRSTKVIKIYIIWSLAWLGFTVSNISFFHILKYKLKKVIMTMTLSDFEAHDKS